MVARDPLRFTLLTCVSLLLGVGIAAGQSIVLDPGGSPAASIPGTVDIDSGQHDASSTPAALNVGGAWMTLGDAISGASQPDGVGIKFTDSGESHGTLLYDSANERFVHCESSGDSVLTCDSGSETLRINVNTGEVTVPNGDLVLNGNDVTGVSEVQGHMAGRGRVCPQNHFLYSGYCVEKALHHAEYTSCPSGTELTRGVCEDMKSYQNVQDAYNTCDSDGGRLPTPEELDRVDGTGAGWDWANAWVQVAETSSDINNDDTGIGLAVRKSRQLDNAGVDLDEENDNDEIAAVEFKTTINELDEYGGDGELGAVHCAYDP